MQPETNAESRRDLSSFLTLLAQFAVDRNWEQYHTPRSLAVSVAVEVGELLEHVQWIDGEEVGQYLQDNKNRVAMGEELADVLIYSLRLCQVLGLDPLDILFDKMKKNGKKYPPTAGE